MSRQACHSLHKYSQHNAIDNYEGRETGRGFILACLGKYFRHCTCEMNFVEDGQFADRYFS